MITTFKHKSRIITIIATVFTALGTLTVEQWTNILPPELSQYATIIVILIGFIVAQLSEEKRVEVAQKLVHLTYQNDESEESL